MKCLMRRQWSSLRRQDNKQLLEGTLLSNAKLVMKCFRRKYEYCMYAVSHTQSHCNPSTRQKLLHSRRSCNLHVHGVQLTRLLSSVASSSVGCSSNLMQYSLSLLPIYTAPCFCGSTRHRAYKRTDLGVKEFVWCTR